MQAILLLLLCLLTAAPARASDASSWRTPTADEQRLDAAAFDGMDQRIRQSFGDVQSAVLVLQGRKLYEFHRDDHPAALRPVHSVVKSALALLVGTALQRGQLTSLDQPVLALMPEWAALNKHPRADAITLRHLLAMTAGFDVDDPSGTAPALAPTAAWARPLGATAGERFAYDNSIPPLIAAILEKVSGQPIDTLAQDQLLTPLAMQAPDLTAGRLSMRTDDMAKLGMLMLSDGHWGGHPLLPSGFTALLVRPHSAGGAPIGLPYGLLWWVPSPNTYFASGHGGQLVWVHAPMDLVIAITSPASQPSAERRQALDLARGPLFQAAQKRIKAAPGP